MVRKQHDLVSKEFAKNFIKKLEANYEKCAFCGKQKRIGKPCTCDFGGVFG